MKCFIASAFGHDDVDAVYDNCVNPLLKQLSITPLRADRVVHNEDIDDKIFELLDTADFAIADLTYARPSVYYEAGYATGKGKPVIYIARDDHFKASDRDPEGFLRIHFDLQMKNTIPWAHTNESFSKQLLARLHYVLKPLIKKGKADKKLIAEQSKFEHLALYDRLKLLRTKAVSLLFVRRFQEFIPSYVPLNGKYPTLSAFVSRDRQEVGIFCTSAVSKILFKRLEYRTPLKRSLNSDQTPTETHFIIASLKPVRRSQITDSLPSFHVLNDSSHRYLDLSKSRPEATIFIHIIDNVKSVSEFSNVFKELLQQNDLNKSA